ncbi:MAG: glycerate kinase [Desulfobacterota bacterium]|jgi:hydroxypyruvate reductase|nr:glycerate kinase [Thermodesulfobacteriota bacterium]
MEAESTDLLRTMRSQAETIFRASLKRIDPYEAVKRFLRLEGDRLILHQEGRAEVVLDLQKIDRVFVVGGGKATAPMARAVEDILDRRIRKGIINVKYGFGEKLLHTEITEAGHPLPDPKGAEGARKILDLLESAREADLIVSLISGGGSALLPLPAGVITLAEKQALTQKLLECGATIEEINTLRKHISLSKGGQLARAAFPATTLNLMLSDVVGDKMDVIASGPFVPDQSTFEEAWAIIEKYGLTDIPESIKVHLRKGLEGKIPETPKAGDVVFSRVFNRIVGSNLLALEAAKAEAERMGYRTLILSSTIEGETKEVARVHTAIAREILASGQPLPVPACVLSGGETTVTIQGRGLGGRNQEFCLAAALDLAALPARAVILSGGTDGNDGPTPAAGAIVDAHTVQRGIQVRVKAAEYLRNNDSFHFFEKTGELLVTGPTKTNVMDVRLVLVR